MVSVLRSCGDGDRPDFHAWLRELKERGSNLLVTGDVPDTVSATASRTLFGRGTDRYRTLALVDRTVAAPESRLPDDASVDDSTTWIVDQRNCERSIPADATSVTSNLEPPERNDVGQLCEELRTAIGFFEERADGLDPARLRVGVDSLSPLVQRDLAATKRHLRTLTATVRGVDGMAHYHLRVPDDEDVVAALTPLFDVRIELRKRPGRNPEQRWHVPELDATTMWVEL
ncbi:hypothetical protein DMJ13_06185 [halophilic archaeon]|nr:hypothetical protein DMJ13_06185 [halophilic archaeon]